MTMKQLLHCTLIFLVLVTSGCDLLSSPDPSPPPRNTNSPSTPSPRNSIKFDGARTDVAEALKSLNSTGKSGSSPKVNSVKSRVDDAIRKLGAEDSIGDRCKDCSAETKDEAIAVLQLLSRISTRLAPDLQKQVEDLGQDPQKTLQADLTEAERKLSQLEIKQASPENSSSSNSSVTSNSDASNKNNNNTDDSLLWNTLELALKIIGGVLVLALLLTGLSYLWKRAWKTFEFNMGHVVARHLAATRDAQPDYTSKLSSLSSTQSEMSSTLSELNTEVRSLARLVRESITIRRSDGHPSYSGFNYQSHTENMSPKDEPEFPVSAVDYLGKMNRFANVVRPDFQNGILVNAPDGDGELVLIRDSRDETQPLFVVPRATQFQTKQDYYTYYQKYYECDRPSAGDVWIIGPAVVEKVTGGWQLREKGMLEVR